MNSFSRSAPELMVQYAHYHRDRRNIATHLVGVPLIFTAIALWLAFPLGRWAPYGITAAWVVWALTSFWYLTRQAPLLGLVTAAVNGLLVALAHTLAGLSPAWGLAPWMLGLALFVVGWVFQFVGHGHDGLLGHRFQKAHADDLWGLAHLEILVHLELLEDQYPY